MKQGVQPIEGPARAPAAGLVAIEAPKERRPAALAIAVVALVLLAQVLWLSRNRAPMLWDDSMYAAGALELYDAMDARGVTGIAERFIRGPAGAKAPLICLLPVPLFLVFGRGSEWAFHGVELIAFALACFAAYRLVRRLSDGWGGFIAVALLSSMPLVVGLTRQFLVEVPLLAAVVLWHDFLFRSAFLEHRGYETKLGVTLGLGMLLKVSFPLFILGSILAGAGLHLGRGTLRAAGLWRRSAAVLGLGGLIAGVWYGPNLVPLVQFAWSSSFGSLAQHYHLPLTIYIAQIFSFGCSNLQLVLIALAAIAVGVRRKTVDRSRSSCENAAIVAIGLWLAVPLAVFLASHDRIVRLTLPCLAAVPVAGGLLGSAFRRRLPRLFSAWAAVCVISGIALFCSFSFGMSPIDRLAAGPLVFWGNQLDWDQGPPDPVAWPHRSIVRAANATLAGASGSTVFLLTNQSRLNWLNLKLAALQERIPLNFDFAGAYGDAESILKRARSSPLVLVQEGGSKGPEWTEATGRSLAGRLGGFTHVCDWRLPDGGTLRFYRNEAPDSKAVSNNECANLERGWVSSKTVVIDRTLLTDLEGLVAPTAAGDPMSPLRWTAKSSRHLAAAPQRLGHQVSRQLVSELPATAGSSSQANRKTREGASHPDRDAQFRYINEPGPPVPTGDATSNLGRHQGEGTGRGLQKHGTGMAAARPAHAGARTDSLIRERGKATDPALEMGAATTRQPHRRGAHRLPLPARDDTDPSPTRASTLIRSLIV